MFDILTYEKTLEEDKENKRASTISNDQKEYENAINAMHLAIKRFDVQGVENILHTGLQARYIVIDNHKGRNPLHALIWHYASLRAEGASVPNSHLKVIDMLTLFLQNGVDINDADSRGNTVLHLACNFENNPEIIRILLASGVHVNRKDCQQQTALHLVASKGRISDLTTLLDGGADPNVSDSRGFTPLHLAAKRKDGSEFIKTLARYGGFVDSHTKSRTTKGPAPIHLAARFNRTVNVRALLTLGARSDIGDSAGQTPLHMAAHHDMTGDTVATLLKGGASVNPKDVLYRETPLHKAVRGERANNIIRLLYHRANPNVQDDLGETPLHKAAAGCSDMLIWRHLLLARGDSTLPNRDGFSPYQKALKAKNMTGVAMMKQYDPRVES